eukprot:6031576-Amphidinium_carterae.1
MFQCCEVVACGVAHGGDGDACKCVRRITYHNGVAISKLRGAEGGIFQYNWIDVPGDGRATQRFALHGFMAGLGGIQVSSHQLVADATQEYRRAGSDSNVGGGGGGGGGGG